VCVGGDVCVRKREREIVTPRQRESPGPLWAVVPWGKIITQAGKLPGYVAQSSSSRIYKVIRLCVVCVCSVNRLNALHVLSANRSSSVLL